MIYMSDSNGNLIPFANDNQGNFGGWTYIYETLTTSTSATTIDLTTILPFLDNNKEYEVMLSGYLENTSGSNVFSKIDVYTDVLGTSTQKICVTSANCQANSRLYKAENTIIVPVHRYIYCVPSIVDVVSLKILGYKRIK